MAAVAFRDLAGSVFRMPLALVLALDDIQGKYRRTVLGPIWIAIGQGATIAAFLTVFSGLFQMDPKTYALYLAAGLPTWALLASFLSEGPSAFVAAKGLIETFEIPWITHIWRRSIGYVLVFFHQILTLFAVMAVLQVPPTWDMLYVFPALGVITVAGTGVGMMLAVLGARYRDLQPAMGIATGFLFLFSPVVWRAEQLQVNQWAVDYNPLYHFVRLLRDPLLGQPVEPSLWFRASAAAVILFVVGFVVFMLSRRRLYHWL